MIKKRRPLRKLRLPPFRRRTRPGAAPGTIRTDPDAPPSVCRLIRFSEHAFHEQQVTDLDDLPGLLVGQRVVWLNVDGLGDAKVIEKIGEVFGIHPLALEDVVNVHQRPKTEVYGEQLFVVSRMARVNGRLETEQISFCLGANFVVTFQERPGDCLESVRVRLRNGVRRIQTLGADYLLYALIDAVIDGQFPAVERLGDTLEALEESVSRDFRHDAIEQIHEVQHDLRMLRKLAWSERDALNALVRDESPLIAQGTRIYLRDCYDHTLQILDTVETYREMCADLRDYYFSRISNRTNDIMKLLTIIATIFIPLGFIAGVYGMNFETHVSPWNMPELQWYYGYPFALGLMSSVALVLLAYFWWRGWLGG
jgi:magnesium transporter